jgi:WhiB family transcriptional regulator, redox-sensing transcriptional regulator
VTTNLAHLADEAPINASWRQDAACRSLPDSMFFLAGDDFAGMKAAKAVCEQCPVQDECLEFAVLTNQSLGIWGGTTPNERRQIRRRWLRELREAS